MHITVTESLRYAIRIYFFKIYIMNKLTCIEKKAKCSLSSECKPNDISRQTLYLNAMCHF